MALPQNLKSLFLEIFLGLREPFKGSETLEGVFARPPEKKTFWPPLEQLVVSIGGFSMKRHEI